MEFKLSTFITCLFAIGLFQTSQAQDVPGRKYIDKLYGCYSVNFRYAETFSPDPHYKYHDREDMNALELILPIYASDKKVEMQHLLIVGDSTIVKHWREIWEYEAQEIFEYQGDRKWTLRKLKPEEYKNTWTQTVWEVSDEPRYQGMSAWIENDGKVFWENTANAPLPRREYTIRDDYNIMRRRNRIELKEDGGYVHEQDNDKINKKDGKETLIAQEKGYNTYYKLEDKECAQALQWWEKNKDFWATVRTNWNQYLSQTQTVSIKNKVDDKMLHEHLFALWREWKDQKIAADQLNQKVEEVIGKFR